MLGTFRNFVLNRAVENPKMVRTAAFCQRIELEALGTKRLKLAFGFAELASID